MVFFTLMIDTRYRLTFILNSPMSTCCYQVLNTYLTAYVHTLAIYFTLSIDNDDFHLLPYRLDVSGFKAMITFINDHIDDDIYTYFFDDDICLHLYLFLCYLVFDRWIYTRDQNIVVVVLLFV